MLRDEQLIEWERLLAAFPYRVELAVLCRICGAPLHVRHSCAGWIDRPMVAANPLGASAGLLIHEALPALLAEVRRLRAEQPSRVLGLHIQTGE